MSVDWKPGMVDTNGDVVGYTDGSGRAYIRDEAGAVRCFVPAAEIDYSNLSNVGHILAYVQQKKPDVTVGLRHEPDLRPGWSGPGWVGQIGDRWFINPDRADVLKRMVEASDG
jgi:hypothetical protein